jgi:hypothetical protein
MTIINLLPCLYAPEWECIIVSDRDHWISSGLARITIAGQEVELIEETIAQILRLAHHGAKLGLRERPAPSLEYSEKSRRSRIASKPGSKAAAAAFPEAGGSGSDWLALWSVAPRS